MSFFDDTKKVGLALWVAGILMIIAAIMNIYFGLTDADVKADDTRIGWVIIGVGSLICAFIFFGFGQSVRGGQITDKFTIVTKLVFVVAMITIVSGVFTAISGFGFHDIMTYLIAGVVTIVIGLIILFIYHAITNENVGTFDRIMWIVLVVLFVLSLIFAIVAIFSVSTDNILKFLVNFISAICNIVIYLFMTVYILDKDVKAKFGM